MSHPTSSKPTGKKRSERNTTQMPDPDELVVPDAFKDNPEIVTTVAFVNELYGEFQKVSQRRAEVTSRGQEYTLISGKKYRNRIRCQIAPSVLLAFQYIVKETLAERDGAAEPSMEVFYRTLTRITSQVSVSSLHNTLTHSSVDRTRPSSQGLPPTLLLRQHPRPAQEVGVPTGCNWPKHLLYNQIFHPEGASQGSQKSKGNSVASREGMEAHTALCTSATRTWRDGCWRDCQSARD